MAYPRKGYFMGTIITRYIIVDITDAVYRITVTVLQILHIRSRQGMTEDRTASSSSWGLRRVRQRMAGCEHRYNNTFPRDQQRPVYSILLLWITHEYQPWCLVCGSTVCDSHATRVCCAGLALATHLHYLLETRKISWDMTLAGDDTPIASDRATIYRFLKLCPTGGSMVYDRPDRRQQIAPKGEITVVVLAAQRPCLGRLSSLHPSLNSSVPLFVFLCWSFTSCCRI